MGFVRAVGAQKWLLLAGAAVIASVLAAQKFLGVPVSDELLWFLVVLDLVLISYRAWNQEHSRSAKTQDTSRAPQILVHFDCDSDHPKPLALINASDIPAFEVKVEDVRNGSYVARFDAVSQILKEWIAVSPRIESNGNGALAGQSLMAVLEAPNGDSGSKLFPLRVSYTDFQGRAFQTEYVILYDECSRRAVARLRPGATAAKRGNGSSSGSS
jgi:hypothetical protein